MDRVARRSRLSCHKSTSVCGATVDGWDGSAWLGTRTLHKPRLWSVYELDHVYELANNVLPVESAVAVQIRGGADWRIAGIKALAAL